jgi:hypothetical protein
MSDYMLYREALAASGYTIIKTEELDALRLRITELERELDASRKALKLDEWITDGFGQFYPKYCEGCGAENQIVRPGDCRCGAGCYITKG